MKNGSKILTTAAARRKRWRGERGETLAETMISTLILLIGLLGTMGAISTVAVKQNWNQGDRGTRTTEYAQDKMEQLLALDFNDATSNTAAMYPTQSTGGTGLGGIMTSNSSVGSVTADAPVTSYVDYVNSAGDLQTSSAGASYVRQWSISTNATGKLKTITVVTRALSAGNGQSEPFTKLVSMKSQ